MGIEGTYLNIIKDIYDKHTQTHIHSHKKQQQQGNPTICNNMDIAGGSDGKASACNVGDLGSIPGLGRPPGEGNGNPLQYS